MIPTQQVILFLFASLSVLYLMDAPILCVRTPNKGKTIRGSVIIVILSFLVLVSMFRSPYMADYEPYLDDFRYKTDAEPFFSLIQKIAFYISPRNVGLMGIYLFAVLSITLRVNFFRKYKSLFVAAVLVYISRVYVEQDMIAIRAGLSTAFALYGVYHHSRGNKLKSVLFLISAALSHYSAILFFLVLFINRNKCNSFFYIGILVVSYLLVLAGIQFGKYLDVVQINFILSKLDTYNYDDTYNAFNLLQLGHVFVCLTCWYIQIVKLKECKVVSGMI